MKKHKPVSKRVLTMVPSWFAPNAPSNEMFGIELHDGEVFNAAPRTMFRMLGRETPKGVKPSSAKLLSYTLPPEWGFERKDEALALAKDLCAMLPFRAGHAGFAFEYSRYYPRKACEHAWAQAMRHPGIDIIDPTTDIKSVQADGVRGVNWLTMLDKDYVQQLGGPPKLATGEVISVPNGLIVKAQKAPALGDVNKKDNLPAYREVFKYVEPLTREAFERSPWIPLEKDGGDRTERFLKRFA